MVAFVIVMAGAGQAALGRDVAVDAALGILVPLDVEGRQLGKKEQARIGQMIVYPPGQRAPVGAYFIAVDKPRNCDTGGGAMAPLASRRSQMWAA